MKEGQPGWWEEGGEEEGCVVTSFFSRVKRLLCFRLEGSSGFASRLGCLPVLRGFLDCSTLGLALCREERSSAVGHCAGAAVLPAVPVSGAASWAPEE